VRSLTYPPQPVVSCRPSPVYQPANRTATSRIVARPYGALTCLLSEAAQQNLPLYDAIFVKSKAAPFSSCSILMLAAIVTAVYMIRSRSRDRSDKKLSGTTK